MELANSSCPKGLLVIWEHVVTTPHDHGKESSPAGLEDVLATKWQETSPVEQLGFAQVDTDARVNPQSAFQLTVSPMSVFFLADLVYDVFLIPLNFSKICCIVSFLFALVLFLMHFLILLLTSFSCCLSSLAMVLLSLMSLLISSSPLSVFFASTSCCFLHSSILRLESSFLLFMLPSVLVLLPRLLRVHPTLLYFLRHLLQRVPLLVLLPFCFCAAAAVSVPFFLDTAFNCIISLVDRISFLMLFFAIVLDHAALTPFCLPTFSLILPKSSFVQRFDHKRRHHTTSCFMSPFGVMYVACFSVVFLYIVSTAQTSVASPITSSNLL